MSVATRILTCLTILAVPMLLQAQSPPIDTFATPAQSVTANSGTPIIDQSVAAPVLGGERDIQALWNTGANNIDLQVETVAQELQFSAGTGTDGWGEVVWDGVDGGPGINYTGLGGVDLTAIPGDDRIRLKGVGTDWQSEYTITIFTDAANYCSNAQTIPQLSSNLTVDFLYSGFVVAPCAGTLDLTNVGAIRVHIGSVGNPLVLQDTDTRFAFITTPVELVAFSADE